jgi:hypothetical protein
MMLAALTTVLAAGVATPELAWVLSGYPTTSRGTTRVPVHGATVSVVGRGFTSNVAPGGSMMVLCGLRPAGAECGAAEEQDWAQFMTRAVSFERPDPGNYSRPATVINDTHLTCRTPSVVAAGFASLGISVDGGASWSAPATSSCVSMFPLFSAAVGRRPYLAETEGAVLVQVDSALAADEGLAVSVSLASPALMLLDRVRVAGEQRQRLMFPLDRLATMVNTTMIITLHVPGSNATLQQSRAFVRHQLPIGSNITTSSVDFETGAVLANGRPWLISGVYVLAGNMLVGDDLLLPTDRLHQPGFLAEIERLSKGGLTTLLVYNLNLWPREKRAVFMDDMDVMGVKVLCALWGPEIWYLNTNWTAFTALVDELRGYPALLGYLLRTIICHQTMCICS